MSKNSGGLSREMEEQLWHLLAPCSEDELRKSFKALQKDSSNRYLQKESRPSTALKDNIGRDVIHRQPLFRGTEACKDAKNTYDGRIQSYEHCHKILERLRFVQKVDAIEKTIVENLCSVYYLLPLSFNP